MLHPQTHGKAVGAAVNMVAQTSAELNRPVQFELLACYQQHVGYLAGRARCKAHLSACGLPSMPHLRLVNDAIECSGGIPPALIELSGIKPVSVDCNVPSPIVHTSRYFAFADYCWTKQTM